VKVWVSQILPLLTEIRGIALTVTCAVAGKEVQPFAPVPVIVYTLVPRGLTVAEPLENMYETAPDGFSTKLPPAQIEPLLTVTTGRRPTVIVDTAGAAETQPALLVPITEYDVVAPGLTNAEPPLKV
jgi:hypothetical protein